MDYSENSGPDVLFFLYCSGLIKTGFNILSSFKHHLVLKTFYRFNQTVKCPLDINVHIFINAETG